MKNSVEVIGKNVDGNDVTVIVKRPGVAQESKAKVYANKIFATAVKNGALLRAKLDDYMEEQGLWDETKTEKLKELNKTIIEGVRKIRSGGGKLSEAKKTALDVSDARLASFRMLTNRRDLDGYTAEGQSINAEHDYLCYLCILNEDGSQVFKDVDDYREHADEDYVEQASGKLAEFTNGFDPDWEKKFPENEFLMKYKFVNEDLRLIDKSGNFVSRDGKKLNKDGRFIDSNGNFVNEDGEQVDEEGNLVVDFVEFEDDINID